MSNRQLLQNILSDKISSLNNDDTIHFINNGLFPLLSEHQIDNLLINYFGVYVNDDGSIETDDD